MSKVSVMLAVHGSSCAGIPLTSCHRVFTLCVCAEWFRCERGVESVSASVRV